MATKNITLDTTDWVDVETAASVSFEIDSPYVLTLRGGMKGSICIATQKPNSDFIGHPVKSNESWGYTHKTEGDKVFVKTDTIGTILVLS